MKEEEDTNKEFTEIDRLMKKRKYKESV